MFELSYQLTRADLAAHQRRTVERLARVGGRPWWRSTLAQFMFACALLVGIVLALRTLFVIAGLESFDFISGYFGFLLGVFLVFFTTWQRVYAIRSNMFDDDGPSFRPQTAIIDTDDLRFTSPTFQSSFRWSAIKDITDADDAVTLWIDRGQGVLLPGRAFASADEKSAFLAFARDRMAENREGLAPAPPPKA